MTKGYFKFSSNSCKDSAHLELETSTFDVAVSRPNIVYLHVLKKKKKRISMEIYFHSGVLCWFG